MKLNNSYFFTLREDTNSEESVSGNLLVRSGMIKKTSSGVYMFLPLGFRVLENIKNIIREEMNKINSQELIMPSLVSEEYFIKSGRRNNFGSEMFTLNDRYDKPYCLGPTHEELFTIAAGYKVKSYKDLPFSLYQIGDKFRDERRPRYGLIRVREFFMKDAYSFDKDNEGLDKSYLDMFNSYKKIFDRFSLDYRIVKSDTGAMGGLLSEEFQAISNIGEDTIVTCDCGYASNLDIASDKFILKEKNEEIKSKELIYTPNFKTIEEISNHLNEEKSRFVKTLVYRIDDELYLVLVDGSDEVNETKLRKLMEAKCVELATEEEVKETTKSEVGFAGPVNIDIKIIIDLHIKNKVNFIVGANKTDYHIKNVNLSDFNVYKFGDIRIVKENDLCPLCGKPLKFLKGIEVGNTFKLGTKYSESLNLFYKDENNNLKPVVMGCYGIGPGRVLASIVEQHNDEKGIIWPLDVAPYKVGIVIVNVKDDEQLNAGNKLYEELNKIGISVILDDRQERVGVKFNDIDLIGLPFRITVGRDIINNKVEFKKRNQENIELINIFEIINYVKNLL